MEYPKLNFVTGYARDIGLSRYPNLWQNLIFFLSPSLGKTGQFAYDMTRTFAPAPFPTAGSLVSWIDSGDRGGGPSLQFSQYTGGYNVNNHGILFNTLTTATYPPNFIGNGSYLKGYTFSFWSRSSDGTQNTQFFLYAQQNNFQDSGNYLYFFHSVASQSMNITGWNGGQSGSGSLFANSNIYNGKWHHWVFVVGNPTTYLYLDGKLTGSQTTVNYNLTLPAWMAIGAPGNVGMSKWDLSDFGIWNRPLDVSEVLQLFNGASPLELNVRTPVISGALSLDINVDVRTAKLVVSDINQDVRMFFPSVSDIAQDIRFKRIIYIYDIAQDIRFSFSSIYDLNNDFRSAFRLLSNVREDIRFCKLSLKDVNQDFRTDKFYFKYFYGNALPEEENLETVFYSNATSVSQYSVYVPTGLTVINQFKGDLVKLTWNTDANYGYNIYIISPLPRRKINATIITDHEYYAGDLIENQPYTFIIVGVTPLGVESADSAPASATPTFPDFVGGATRIIPYTFQVKINGSPRADAELSTVELGYGSSPSVARFIIPVDPITVGLPTHEDAVEIIVNSRSIFKGVIKNIEKSLSTSGMAVSYIAYSKLIYQTYESVTWDYILQIRQEYNLDISDQTTLQAYETIANFQGNYRLYYNMQTDAIEEYQLGTGYWNRNVTIGKNVLEWNVTEDTTSRVTQMTLRGGRKKTRTGWGDLTFKTITLGTLPYATQDISVATITAFNISDIQVEAHITESEPTFNFDPKIAVIPSDFGKTIWDDGTIEPKQKVLGYQNPSRVWRPAGTNIVYTYQQIGNESIPISATITLNQHPAYHKANVKQYANGKRLGRIPAEDVEFGTVAVAYRTISGAAACRICYSYEETNPTEMPKGSGTPARTVTDTQYKPYDDHFEGVDDTAYVITQMDTRAEGELDKVNRPIVTGRVQILGDETFDLKTMLDIDGQFLDVIRVTHNFSRGFTTDLELTNEKFRVNIPAYQDYRKKIEYERKVTGTQSLLDSFNKKISQAKSTPLTSQAIASAIPKSPFAIYGD